MAQSYGLINHVGTIVNGTNDFTSTKRGVGRHWLKFNRDVSNAIVVATVRNLFNCDTSGIPITVCYVVQDESSRTVGVTFPDEYDNHGFSFVLID